MAGNHQHDTHDHDDHGHSHSHTTFDAELASHGAAVRAIWISVAGLGLTAVFQLAIVAITDSAGLFADALHNVGDVAGTAALWLGFRLSRRPASDQFTYGWRRAEDLAGLFIVLAIAVSALLAGWDSLGALLDEGHRVRNLGAAFGAAVVGAVGNEAVAIYKIRVGTRIGSAPLVADGQHARVDGLVSLGAAVGVIGVWLGFPLADPLAGLAITGTIVWILVRTGREVLVRNLDAVDPALVEQIRSVTRAVEGVRDVHAVRARHAGRSLLAQLHVAVDGDLSLRAAHRIGEEVRHALVHDVPNLHEVDVHVDPDDDGAHELTAHHFAEDEPSSVETADES